MAQITLFNVRLGKDVEVKGDRCYFSVAETITVKGEKTAQWYSVSYYSPKIAEMIGKGCTVTVQGNPSFKVYKDKVDISVWADKVIIHTYKDKGEAPSTDEGTPEEDKLPF